MSSAGGGARSGAREEKMAEAKEQAKIAKMKKRSRRGTVCAAPVVVEKGWQPPVHPKTASETADLERYVSKNALFKSLDGQERGVLVRAMEKKRYAPGRRIIRQGDVGDYFYIVQAGHCEIFVSGEGKVQDCHEGASFGELALMYDAPRAATVAAAEAEPAGVVAWALDQTTFKKLLMTVMMRKRKLHEGFLARVPLFKDLSSFQFNGLVDALVASEYAAGDAIINEGEEGDRFYVIESGSVTCSFRGRTVCERLGGGDYFGEIALLTDTGRKASVTALEATRCQSVDRDTFHRLFGPLKEILSTNIERWDKFLDDVEENDASVPTTFAAGGGSDEGKRGGGDAKK